MLATLIFLVTNDVPEPALLALLAVGAGIVFAVKRRK